MSQAVTDKSPADTLHPLVQQIVENRDIGDLESFLSPTYESELHDPYAFDQMQEFVDRLADAIKSDERIVIFSDFDTDGIPAAVMWHDLFSELRYENFDIYIPKRDIEGFGLKVSQVEDFHEEGADLLVTVDCGIRSHEAVTLAKECGMGVAILDHHVPAKENPPADIIINPALEDETYPFDSLCGAGVVFKCLQALEADDRFDLPTNFTKGQLGMVAVATISDMVPLVGENRALAYFGLQILRQTTRPGLRELYEKGRIQGRELTEVDVGFTIGSHINAASRLDQPMSAFRLLTTRSYKAGKTLASELHSLYRTRKRRTAKLKESISKAGVEYESSPVIAFGSDDWKPALLGPVAHSLSDTYGVPVFLWGESNGCNKGSARANSHNVVEMMQAIADKFLHAYGGHEMAGGFELNKEEIDGFLPALAEIVDDHQVLDTQIANDPIPASLADISWELYASLEKLGPFGVGNAAPLFLVSNVQVDDKRLFGGGNEHVSLTLTDGEHDQEAVCFFATEEMKSVEVGQAVTVTGALEKSTFGFGRNLQFRMESISTSD